MEAALEDKWKTEYMQRLLKDLEERGGNADLELAQVMDGDESGAYEVAAPP